MFKGIIFDLDGTLIDSRNDLGNSVNRTLIKHGLEPHPMDMYNQFVGNGIRKLVERAFPKNYVHLEMALLDFMEDYRDHITDAILFYEGIELMLKKLNQHKIPIAVCTNKEQSLTNKIFETYFKEYDFVDVVGDQFDGQQKPNPFHVNQLINKMNLSREVILFVGDSNVDIQTAQNAKLKSCGVAWGFRGETELRESGATYIARNVNDIIQLVI